eukprot:1339543-Alexandrium_andersonii.AAC.1
MPVRSIRPTHPPVQSNGTTALCTPSPVERPPWRGADALQGREPKRVAPPQMPRMRLPPRTGLAKPRVKVPQRTVQKAADGSTRLER